MTTDHAAGITADHAADIDKHVKVYITVFVTLMALTIITVAISRFHLPIPIAVSVALLVAIIKGSLVASIAMGCGFLVVKYFEYSHKFHDGLFPRSSNFLAIYFTLTGLHMLHVIGGMAVNAYFLGPGAKLYKTNPVWFTNRVEHSGLFWHFVDLVWIFLFPTLYLL